MHYRTCLLDEDEFLALHGVHVCYIIF